MKKGEWLEGINQCTVPDEHASFTQGMQSNGCSHIQCEKWEEINNFFTSGKFSSAT